MSVIHPTRMSLSAPDTPLYTYLLSHEPSEHEALCGLREATSGMANSFMQIAPDQGHFMALIVKLMGQTAFLNWALSPDTARWRWLWRCPRTER